MSLERKALKVFFFSCPAYAAQPSLLVPAVMLVTCIDTVPRLNLSWDAVVLTEVFHGFPHSLYANAGIVPHLSIIIIHLLPFGAV